MTATQPQHRPESDVMALMKRMGAKSFDPLPPSQHQWQRAKGEPPLQRAWSWMCDATIHRNPRSEFAVSEKQKPLTLAHMAADLDMDEANTHRTWKQGLERGLWRFGTAEEGERRLYLRGDVPEPKEEDGKKPEIVCTDNLQRYLLRLPRYLARQLKDLPAERLAGFVQEHVDCEETEALLVSAAVAAAREVAMQQQDTLFAKYGVEKTREEHPNRSVDPTEVGVRAALAGSLATVIQQSVPTVIEFVQTRNATLYKPQNADTLTTPSLLPSEPLQNPSERAGAVSRNGRGEAERTLPKDGKESVNQQYDRQSRNSATAWPKPENKLPELDGEERAAENLAFNLIRAAQEGFPHTDFSRELISRDDAGDVATVRLILRIVTPALMREFLAYMAEQFRALDRRAFGKLPARAEEFPSFPRSLGLIVAWAKKFMRLREANLAANQTNEAMREIDKARREIRQEAGSPLTRDEEKKYCLAVLADTQMSKYIHECARLLLRAEKEPQS